LENVSLVKRLDMNRKFSRSLPVQTGILDYKSTLHLSRLLNKPKKKKILLWRKCLLVSSMNNNSTQIVDMFSFFAIFSFSEQHRDEIT